jgi:hypothetical protein
MEHPLQLSVYFLNHYDAIPIDRVFLLERHQPVHDVALRLLTHENID